MPKPESVKSLHQRLRAAFPAKWDSETDTLAVTELTEMVKAFGFNRTQQAVNTFIRGEEFFSVAKLRQYVPAPSNVKRMYDVECPHCDEGWQEIQFHDMHPNDKNNLIRLYGLEQAHSFTVRARCRFCWSGPSAIEKAAAVNS
jgi:hypothetical protein